MNTSCFCESCYLFTILGMGMDVVISLYAFMYIYVYKS